MTVGFLAKDWEGKAEVMEPDEITEWQWFDLGDLPSPMFPPSAKFINNYKAGKLYQP